MTINGTNIFSLMTDDRYEGAFLVQGNVFDIVADGQEYALPAPPSVPLPPSTPTPPACQAAAAPDGTGAPAQFLNLSGWKLQTDLPKCDAAPGVREVRWPELASFVSSRFHVNATGGTTGGTTGGNTSVVFVAALDGATTQGTSYPRTELREVTEWSIQQGRHMLTARVAVHQLPGPPASGVIVAQVKDSLSQPPLLKLRAKVFGSTDPMFRLEARVKYADTDGTLAERGLAFDRLFSAGEAFDIRLTVEQLQLDVTVGAVGEAPQTVTYSYAGIEPFSSTAGQPFYFKAGAYCQSNAAVSPAGEGCEVRLHSLAVEHSLPSPSTPSPSAPSPSTVGQCSNTQCGSCRYSCQTMSPLSKVCAGAPVNACPCAPLPPWCAE